MATISYTNSWQLLYKLILIFASIMLFVAMITIADTVPKGWTNWLPEWLQVIGVIVLFFGGLAGGSALLQKTVWPWWLSSWCYINVDLGIRVSAKEAEAASFLFDGSIGEGQWFPLKGFRKIDKELRREALFRFANHVSRQNGWRVPFPDVDRREQQEQQASDRASREGSERDRFEHALTSALSVLGLRDVPASLETIKLAYRRRVSQYHPDKLAGEPADVLQYADEMTKRVNAAYAFLERVYEARAKHASTV